MGRYSPPPARGFAATVTVRNMPAQSLMGSPATPTTCGFTITTPAVQVLNNPQLTWVKKILVYVDVSYALDSCTCLGGTIETTFNVYRDGVLYAAGSNAVDSFQNTTAESHSYNHVISRDCVGGTWDGTVSGSANTVVEVYAGSTQANDVVVEDTIPGYVHGLLTDAQPAYYKFLLDGEEVTPYAWRTAGNDLVAYLPLDKRLNKGQKLQLITKTAVDPATYINNAISKFDYITE